MKFQFDQNFLLKHFGFYSLLDNLFEALLKLNDIFFAHGQSRSILVSTKLVQQFATFAQRFVQLNAWYGARRAGDMAIGAREDDRRTVVFFSQPRGYNSDYPFVPIRLVEHGGFALYLYFVVVDQRQRFLGDAEVHILADSVLIVYGNRECLGFFFAFGDE